MTGTTIPALISKDVPPTTTATKQSRPTSASKTKPSDVPKPKPLGTSSKAGSKGNIAKTQASNPAPLQAKTKSAAQSKHGSKGNLAEKKVEKKDDTKVKEEVKPSEKKEAEKKDGEKKDVEKKDAEKKDTEKKDEKNDAEKKAEKKDVEKKDAEKKDNSEKKEIKQSEKSSRPISAKRHSIAAPQAAMVNNSTTISAKPISRPISAKAPFNNWGMGLKVLEKENISLKAELEAKNREIESLKAQILKNTTAPKELKKE
ncbi:hypothetical protein HK096_008115, partial [Nowakowskiella sp. JEL0078]